MRQLCNATYASVVSGMDEKEKDLFDRKLVADDPNRVSHGTQALLGLFASGGRR